MTHESVDELIPRHHIRKKPFPKLLIILDFLYLTELKFRISLAIQEVKRPGGGFTIYPWVGRCGAAPHTLTLFKTNIADFPTLFKTEFRFLIPCLRHLSCLRQKLINRYPD